MKVLDIYIYIYIYIIYSFYIKTKLLEYTIKVSLNIFVNTSECEKIIILR